MKITKTQLKDLIYQVTGAAITVHKELGPGLLESVYHHCMKIELTDRNINYISELIAPIEFKGNKLDAKLRCDLFIEDILPVELKAVSFITPIDEAQIITYMKLLQRPKGLLFNFNTINISKEGQRAFVNELYKNLAD